MLLGGRWQRVEGGWLLTRRKGAEGFFVSLEAETTRVVERKHKRPVNGGVHNQKGREVQSLVNSDQCSKPSLKIPKSLCVVANDDQKDRRLTVVMGYGTQGLYGYSASRYCAIGEGFLGRRVGEFERRVQTMASLFESQG
jgi:hypothetical protein